MGMPSEARFAAFRHRDFRRLQTARVSGVVALQVQSVATAWQILDATHDPLALGAVGLAQFVPLVLTIPFGGMAADRYERRGIVGLAFLAYALACAGLLASAHSWPGEVPALYALLVFIGAIRAFIGPAAAAMLADVVPSEDLPNAIAWSSSAFQLATIGGPAVGGLLYRFGGAELAYAFATGTFALASLLVAGMARRAPAHGSKRASVLEGLRFLVRHRTLLAATSLDLVAVILAGAVALLPLVADELGIGPDGLGLLRAAPAFGAMLVGAWLAHRPIEEHAGAAMLASVAGFGACTVVFGLTRDPYVAFAALAVSGAFDMLSVFVRQSLVQRTIPSEVRGRVSAVNLVFVSASNELGEMESGVTARWLGVRPAIVAGGVAAMVAALGFALFSRSLRTLDLSFTQLRKASEGEPNGDGSRSS